MVVVQDLPACRHPNLLSLFVWRLPLLQPRCAEPWTEVIFESGETGRLQVLVAPLVRLTNRAEARIQDIGPPEGLLTSLGPFITGEGEALVQEGVGVERRCCSVAVICCCSCSTGGGCPC
jgi:hypothetical protein